MARLLRSVRALTAFGLASSLGCSLIGTADYEECASTSDCRAAFGFGSVCGSDGLCAAATAAPRCTQTFPEDLWSSPEKYKDAIVLGSLMDRSSSTHAAREKSSRLAAKQVNDEGGVEGKEFAVVYCTYEADLAFDDLEPADAAVASAHYLVDQLGVPAILGPAGSADTSAVYQALANTGTLVMSPSATSPALTGLDSDASDAAPGLLWRTAPPDTLRWPSLQGSSGGSGSGPAGTCPRPGWHRR